MKRIALVALVLMLAASAALADYNIQDKGTYRINANSGQVVDATGAAIVNLNNAPQDYELIAPNFLSSLFFNAGGAQITGTVTVDSSGTPIDVSGFSRLALLVEPTLDDSATCALVGIKVRIGITAASDSNSVYTVPTRGSFATAATAVADTIGSLWDVNAGLIATDSTAAHNERVFVAYGNGKWFGPRNQIVYLTDRNGLPITGPYISVVWRILQTYGPFPAITAHGYLNEKRVTMRAHLIGWR